MKPRLIVLTFTMTMLVYSSNLLGSVRVPYPGCYDYHGCGVDEMSESQYVQIWQSYGFMTPPHDYAHLDDGNIAYRYGNNVYIKSPSGTPIVSGSIRANPWALIVGALSSLIVLWYDEEGCMGWPTMTSDCGVFSVWKYLESDGKERYPMPGYDSRETFLEHGKLSFKTLGACHNTEDYGK